MKAKDIIARHDAALNERKGIERMWEFMSRWVIPYKADLYCSEESDGTMDWRIRDIYDSTAPIAAKGLAASIQSNLVSPSVKWYDLSFSDKELNDDDESAEWIEECGEVIYTTLQESDFNEASPECLDEVVGMGNMCMVQEIDEEQTGLDFTAVPIIECCFEVGSKGQVMRFYRWLKWTALQIMDKFGEDDLPDMVQKALDNNDLNTKFDITFCIYKRPVREVEQVADLSRPVAARARPFGFKYVLRESVKELGNEGGYYEMPVYFTRWRTRPGSIWGIGPGFDALAEIMDLNEFKEIMFEKAAQDLEPPLMVTAQALVTQLARQRGSVTVVNDINGVAELPGRGDAKMAGMSIEELKASVSRAFFEDKLQLKDSPAMTATEVQRRYELMQRLLGPTNGRLKVDWLDKVITNSFWQLYRLGRLPPVPQIVKDKKPHFEIEYTGPLPRAQKSDQAYSTAGWLGQVGNLAAIYPLALDVPDWDEAIRGMGTLQGVPARFMRGIKEIMKDREARAKRDAKQQKIEELKQKGEAGKMIGEAGQTLSPEAIGAIQGAIDNA